MKSLAPTLSVALLIGLGAAAGFSVVVAPPGAGVFVAGAVFLGAAIAVLFHASAHRRHVSEPLEHLGRHVDVLARGELSVPVPADFHGDVAAVAARLESLRQSWLEARSRLRSDLASAREIDRMKDDLLAGAAHEIKTPLNGVSAALDSLLIGACGDLTPEQRQSAEIARRCADRLLKQVGSVLEFSRLAKEGEVEPLALETHCLAEHLDEAISDLRAGAETAGLGVRFNIPEDFQGKYCREDLEQVLRILVDNAAKYTQSGTIEILALRWQGGPQEGFQIAVRDTGPGIPIELQGRVFAPFVHGHEHKSRARGGVGLGLAIAARIVSRMGGQIHLVSEPGRGSTFTILVAEGPRRVADLRECARPWPPMTDSTREWAIRSKGAERVVSTEPAGAPPSVPHVLVADDGSSYRDVAWQALRDGCRVTRAADGEGALDVLRKQPVDVVLLDLSMPGLSGYDVLSAIREEGLGAGVPIIVLAASPSREDLERALALGASDHLDKPFQRAQLLCRVRVHLELRALRRAVVRPAELAVG